MTLAPSNWGALFFFPLMQEREASLADIRGITTAIDRADVTRAPLHVSAGGARPPRSRQGVSGSDTVTPMASAQLLRSAWSTPQPPFPTNSH